MPLRIVRLKAGVDTQRTPTLNQESWSASNLIRWFEGLPQKLGGWIAMNVTPLVGTGRGMHAWADLMGNPYVAVGTEQRLELCYGGVMYDITPLRATTNPSPSFSTTISSATVTVTDTANGASVGDWVNIFVPVSVGGIVLQGFYQVQTVVDANNYTITAASPATANVSNGGAVPSFTTTITSANISVTLNNHGLTTSNQFVIQVATTVGGITITAGTSTNVTSVTNANVFVIAPDGVASGSATVFENSGNARIQYLIATGLVSATAQGGYGAGPYGSGPYGGSSTSSQLVFPLRQWFLDNWGQDLVANYTGGTIYYWVPPIAFNNLALPLSSITASGGSPAATSVPTKANGIFVAMPEQILVAWGTDGTNVIAPTSPFGDGNQDANLVRWSDVSAFQTWFPTATNQAGSFRIPTGSRIVGGLQGQQFGFIWTDIDFWLMTYVQPPLVFGFQKVSGGDGLLAARAMGIYQSTVYWVGPNNFMQFDGNSVQIIPCTVWDKFFANLNTMQLDKVWCWVNSLFKEIWWFYPSASSSEVDSYIKVNVAEGYAWDYGSLPRTCGQDQNVFGHPLATDTSGFIQQHEFGNDANGIPMLPSITSGYFQIEDGTYFSHVERAIADFVLTTSISGGTPQVQYSLLVADYPPDTPTVFGPYTWTNGGPQYQIIRGRGRVGALQISSNGLGSFWRLGGLRLNVSPAGRR